MVNMRKMKDPTNPRLPGTIYYLEWHCLNCGNFHVRKLDEARVGGNLYTLIKDTTENAGRIRLAAPANFSCKARPNVGDL